jgi:ATP-binding cassette subfamily F protein 3
VCTHILEIHDGHTRGYAGNYSAFLQQKELFLQTLADRIDKCEKEIKRLTGALQSMKRANKFDKSISQKHQMLSRSQKELKWLKTLKPSERRELQFDLQSTEKSSLDVLDFRQASLKFEGLSRSILNQVDIGVSRGQKIGIVGANGAGKTTLLRIINGEVKLDEGVIDVRPGVEIGYFHQDHRTLDFDLTPVEQVQKLKPRMEYGKIRAMLGQFQFTPEMVSTPLNKLSGGERARIAMLKLLLEDNNMLLLDEPTNHLDTDAKEALEETLKEYDGCILTVSHDRWFLDKVCDTIWELPGDGTICVYPGNYSDYLQRKRNA